MDNKDILEIEKNDNVINKDSSQTIKCSGKVIVCDGFKSNDYLLSRIFVNFTPSNLKLLFKNKKFLLLFLKEIKTHQDFNNLWFIIEDYSFKNFECSIDELSDINYNILYDNIFNGGDYSVSIKADHIIEKFCLSDEFQLEDLEQTINYQQLYYHPYFIFGRLINYFGDNTQDLKNKINENKSLITKSSVLTKLFIKLDNKNLNIKYNIYNNIWRKLRKLDEIKSFRKILFGTNVKIIDLFKELSGKNKNYLNDKEIKELKENIEKSLFNLLPHSNYMKNNTRTFAEKKTSNTFRRIDK